MKKIILLALMLVTFLAVNAQQKSYSNLKTEPFMEAVSHDDMQILDVRTPNEFSQGHIKNAKNINIFNKDFVKQVTKTLDKKKTVYVYCRSGGRSAKASAILSDAGYDVVNLLGGFMGWQSAKYPIEK